MATTKTGGTWLSRADVAEMKGVTEQHIWRLVNDPNSDFPKPLDHKKGGRMVWATWQFPEHFPPELDEPAADAEAEAEAVPVQTVYEYPPPRDRSLPPWAHAARLNFIDLRIAVALADECSTPEIKQAIEEIKKLDPDHDVHLLRNVLFARASGQLPEPAPPPRRRRH